MSFLLSVCLLFGACTADVHHGLDERGANEVIAALLAEGIPARKTSETPPTGPWTVSVPRTVSQRAVAVLAEAGLPRRADDLDSLLADGGLVPSSDQDHVRRVAYVERSLATTLRALDGVVDARVHTALPASEPALMGSRTRAEPRVSVLLVQRVESPGPPDEAVRSMVMGSVDGLASDRIAIVRSQVSVPQAPDLALVSVGPFAVAEDSATPLRLVLLSGLGSCGLLALLVIALVVRFRRVGR